MGHCGRRELWRVNLGKKRIASAVKGREPLSEREEQERGKESKSTWGNCTRKTFFPKPLTGKRRGAEYYKL